MTNAIRDALRRYDTKAGICKLIQSIAGLNELERERRRIGYDERYEVRLNEFVIMGRWVTDTCGNFCRIIHDFIPKEHLPYIPDVLTTEEFWQFLEDSGFEKGTVHMSWAIGDSGIPPEHVTCPECKLGWVVNNCHDVVNTHDTEVISLADYVGKTLGEVQDEFKKRTDALYFMQRDLLIRNDRFINSNPDPKYPTLKINERGWMRERDGITREYTIQLGDEGHFNVWHYRHTGCYIKQRDETEEKHFREIFEQAEISITSFKAIPNEYTRGIHAAPWYLVATSFGDIKIGWRKRVINIDWSSTKRDLQSIFEEDVTKDTHYIHAWGKEKATEYLKRIKEALECAAVPA